MASIGLGLGVDLVVHVGDVGRIDHRVVAVAPPQQAEQHVEHHHRPEIADVGVVVDRRPTDIHRHPPLVAGDKGPLFAGHGVVKAQGHGATTDVTVAGNGVRPIYRWAWGRATGVATAKLGLT
jgi:hypothetical protein